LPVARPPRLRGLGARFLGAPGPTTIAQYRNTTEAVNAVMYSLLTEFRDGDNVVTTAMERNSNFVPWYAMCRHILPRLGRRTAHPGSYRSAPPPR
jgi:cysteine desulfurase/selenocysteine lyase